MKILIAEDDITSRRILERVLVKWGYEPVLAEDGLKAWEIMQEPQSPQLLLLDWMMPGLDGVELCRRLRAQATAPLIYIILITALNAKENIVAGLEAGADDYISKPFHNEELRARIAAGRRIIELQNSLQNRMLELEDALAHIKTLQGILPICMHCHRIRDDQEVWQKLEQYISEHTEALFSHGLCPECYEKYYGEYLKKT